MTRGREIEYFLGKKELHSIFQCNGKKKKKKLVLQSRSLEDESVSATLRLNWTLDGNSY